MSIIRKIKNQIFGCDFPNMTKGELEAYFMAVIVGTGITSKEIKAKRDNIKTTILNSLDDIMNKDFVKEWNEKKGDLDKVLKMIEEAGDK